MQAGGSKPRGECHGVLLLDSHIEETGREAFREFHHTTAARHRRSDSDDIGVFLGQIAQHLSEYVLVARNRTFGYLSLTRGGVETARCVPNHRVLFRRSVTLSLSRDAVQDARPLQLPQLLEGQHHLFDVVTVDRSEISQANRLEQVSSATLHDPRFQRAYPALQETSEAIIADNIPGPILQGVIALARRYVQKMLVHSAHSLVDGLIIIIQLIKI